MTESSTQYDKPARRFQFQLATLLLIITMICGHFGFASWNPEIVWLIVPILTLPITVIVVTRRSFHASPSRAAACSVLVSVAIWALLGLWLGVGMVSSQSAYEIRKYGWRLEVVPQVTLIGTAIGLGYSLPVFLAYYLVIWISRVYRRLVIEPRAKRGIYSA